MAAFNLDLSKVHIPKDIPVASITEGLKISKSLNQLVHPANFQQPMTIASVSTDFVKDLFAEHLEAQIKKAEAKVKLSETYE